MRVLYTSRSSYLYLAQFGMLSKAFLISSTTKLRLGQNSETMVLEPSHSSVPPDHDFEFSPDLHPPIDLSKLASPAPLVGPLFRFTKSNLRTIIERNFELRAKDVNRPLFPDERAAISFHTAKGYSIASWGPPTGCLMGFQRAYSTRHEFRHPFSGTLKSSRGWFDGERVRIMGRELIRGSSARIFVHLLRSVNYGLVGAGFASFFSTSYASSVAVIGELQDPRLKDVMIALKSKIKSQQERRGTNREEVAAEDDRDEASTLADRGLAEYTNYNGTIGQDEVEVARPDMVQMNSLAPGRNTVERQINTFSGSGNEFRPEERERKNSINDEDGFSFLESELKDPTETGQRIPSGERGWTQEAGGSAWERLRREAISGSDNSSKKPMELGRVAAQTQQPSTDSDSSFSSSKQEQIYSREEAQRDFDQRVEQERAGGNFGLDRAGRRWG